ncbi:nSTAND1 domain-containing NTPase [Streptomyces niveiscabiei]|uniref:HTH cro/C1-type domain-containing protein n=1 Tax=Streptomyces niveiscabiei TaxID=164115 RepID=A0ABW9HVG8_9ACTN
MGRPERPLDPQDGPVQRLAHGLRELRREAGGPSYRTMAKAVGFSTSTLSQAAAGERLPTLAVLRGYVIACGGDPAEWEARWKEAEGETSRAPEAAWAPYRGLARFEPDDEHLFFGRDRMADEVTELVREKRLAVLLGPSGSGKSSLLRAGVIPRLRTEIAARERRADLRILTPGPTPATTYGHLFAAVGKDPAADEQWLLVDQFEELFTLCRDPRERSAFITYLLTAHPRRHLLIAVRADFRARCAEHPALAEALRTASLPLGPLTPEELREAVVGPAQRAGLVVERALTARLVAEVQGEPGALPALSHALLETWRRRKGRILTLAGHEAAGGVGGALVATAEEVYGALSPAQARAARHLLQRMVVPGEGTPDTRRPLTRAELAQWACPDVPAVVERLTRARLLTADEGGVHLAHEALIGGWPRLHGWIEDDRERLRQHRALAEAARTWREHDHDPGVLYRGTRLARAEELFPDHLADPALTAPERTFLTAALDARAAERRATAGAVRRHRVLTVSLAAVLAVAVMTGVLVCRAQDENRLQRTRDAARRVAAVADALRTTDPRTALLLGAAAWSVARLPETRRALLGSLDQPETDTFTDPDPGDSRSRALLDDGRTLLSAAGRTWRTWDVTDHRPTGSGRVPSGTVTAAGPLLAVTGDDQRVRLWNPATGHWAGGPLADVSDLRFTRDGGAVLVTEGDRVRLRSAADGRVLFASAAVETPLTALSTDGRLAAVCPSGGTPQVWDTATGRALPGAWRQDRVCDGDVLAVDGDRLAAATDGGLRVWDTRTGRRIAEADDPGVRYAAFSPDGTFLATADAAELRVWRLTDPDAPVFRHPLDNQHLYGGLAWHGRNLRYLEGGTVHTLDLAAAVTTGRQPPADTRLSPDGRTYATARRTGDHYTVTLHTTSDGHPPHTLPPLRAPANTLPLLAFSPDGTRFAYGVSAPGHQAATQPVTVWDVRRARPLTTLDLPGDPLLQLALGPDLYAARSAPTGAVRDEVWDLTRRRRTRVLAGVTASHLGARPDGGLLLGDGRVAELPSGLTSARDLVQGDQVGAFGFTADGTLLAVGDQTGRVFLWDGDARRREGILRNVGSQGVTALAFSPDGRTLAVAGDAGGLQLWDVATQQPLGGPVTTPGEEIDSVAFGADGTTLYASSAHAPLQRYDVDPERAARRVCERAGGVGLTRAQWRTYIPDAPYRRICGRA